MVCGLKNFQNAARKDVLFAFVSEPSKDGPSAVAAWTQAVANAAIGDRCWYRCRSATGKATRGRRNAGVGILSILRPWRELVFVVVVVHAAPAVADWATIAIVDGVIFAYVRPITTGWPSRGDEIGFTECCP